MSIILKSSADAVLCVFRPLPLVVILYQRFVLQLKVSTESVTKNNTQMKTTPQTKEVKIVRTPFTKKKIAKLLGVSTFVLRGWLASIKEQIGEPIGITYNINQVSFILEKFGTLEKFEKPNVDILLVEGQKGYDKILALKNEIIHKIKNDPTIRLREFIG